MATSSAGLSRLGDRAAKYTRRGWPVFPVAPRGKVPLTPDGFKSATADEGAAAAWWTERPDANIGFVPGQAQLIVLDLDGPEAKAEAQALGLLSEPTLVCVTARGQHRYYQHPGGTIGNRRLAPHIDVRADAGYVLLPPSIHPSGVRYKWEGSLEDIKELPPLALAGIQSGGGNGSAQTASAPLPERIPEGQRNATLASLAGSMRRRNASEATILAALREQNAACDPPLADDELAAIAQSVGRYPPGRAAPPVAPEDKAPGGPAPEPFPLLAFLEGDPPPPPLLHVDRLLLAENFNLFAGAKSSGKSPVLLTVAVSIALGLPCFGTLAVHRAGPVVLVVPEDGQDFARTAVDAIAVGLGLTPEERALLAQRLKLVPDTVRMDLVRDVRRLRQTVQGFGAVALILDPMKRLLPGSDENDNSLADLVAGELLHEICRGAACTVAAAMHEKKPNAKLPDAEPSMHNVRGASAWYAASRMTFNVSQNTAARTIRLHCTAANRVRPDDQHHTLRLSIAAERGNPAAWTSCTLTDLDDGASESLTPGVGRALKESERTALRMLEDEPDTALSWSQWSKRASLPERTFGYAKKALQKAGLVESVPTGRRVPGGGEAKVYRITPAGRNALVGDTARIEE